MALTSYDGLIAAHAAGQSNTVAFQKTSNNAAASAAGRWHDALQWNGIPGAMTLTGTAGTAVQLTSSTAGAWPIGDNVAPLIRHLVAMSATSPTATLVPAQVWLCDFLLLYPSLVVTGTATTLTNGVGLPRYTNGEGVRALVTVTTALGAASPALTFTYTNQAGTSGRVAAAHTSPGNSAPLSSCFLTDGSPFVRLQTGDTGVRSVQSYTLASGTTGNVGLMLVKPLGMPLPLAAINSPHVTDMVTQMPVMPPIQDGACLGLLVQCGGAMIASTQINGTTVFAYG